MRVNRLLLVLITISIFQVSCKKDADHPDYKVPEAAKWGVVLEIPQGLTSDTALGVGKAEFSMMNAIEVFGYAERFNLPEGAKIEKKSENSVTYQWVLGGSLHWMKYEILADKYTWNLESAFPGLQPKQLLSAEEYKKQNKGDWKIWTQGDSNQLLWDYNWEIYPTGSYTATIKYYEGEIVLNTYMILIDGDSGNFREIKGNEMLVEVAWDASGGGSWWAKGDVNGDFSGSW